MKRARHLLRPLRWFVALCLPLVIAALGCGDDTTGPGPEPPSTMDVWLDGTHMSSLQVGPLRNCTAGGDSLALLFTATDDPLPYAIDDEMHVLLGLRIPNASALPIGRDVDVANIPGLALSARVYCFCHGPMNSVTTASGTLRITARTSTRVRGSADLTFTDPTEANAILHDTLRIQVSFALDGPEVCPQ